LLQATLTPTPFAKAGITPPGTELTFLKKGLKGSVLA